MTQFTVLAFIPGVYSDISMYNEWINKIVATEVLPEYEFSPFPKPHAITKVHEEDSQNKSERATTSITFAFISLILAIKSL